MYIYNWTGGDYVLLFIGGVITLVGDSQTHFETGRLSSIGNKDELELSFSLIFRCDEL